MTAASRHLIFHVDIDAFFASVEQLLLPFLRDRPVIVGSGVIASCSYEARRFGLRAGMPLHEARRLCPRAAVLAGDYATYRCFAEGVWRVARRYGLALETFLDEAYGEATGLDAAYGSPEALGRSLQQAVRDEVGLPVSVGLAANRMLAKMASSDAKPNGVVYVAPDRTSDYLAPLPVRKLPGVGRTTERALHDMNIRTVAELRDQPRALLREMFGLRGEVLYCRARGEDFQPVRAAAPPRSISRETTLHRPTCDRAELLAMLGYLLERAMRTARAAGLLAGSVEVSIRYDDWKHLAASRSLPQPTSDDTDARRVAEAIFERLYRRRVALRHLGVVLSRLRPAAEGTTLFEAQRQQQDRRRTAAVDAIRDRWGHAAIVTGRSIDLLGKLRQNDYGFVLRTPSLTK